MLLCDNSSFLQNPLAHEYPNSEIRYMLVFILFHVFDT